MHRLLPCLEVLVPGDTGPHDVRLDRAWGSEAAVYWRCVLQSITFASFWLRARALRR
jgi:hypothetical protein